MFANLGDCLVKPGGQIECSAFPITRQILAAGFDRTVGVDAARTADADEGRELSLSFLAALVSRLSMPIKASMASSRLGFSSPCRHSSNWPISAFDRSSAFFRFKQTTPARILVPPISTARMASWALNIQIGARRAAPISPAPSGSWRMIRISFLILSSFNSTEARPIGVALGEEIVELLFG